MSARVDCHEAAVGLLTLLRLDRVEVAAHRVVGLGVLGVVAHVGHWLLVTSRGVVAGVSGCEEGEEG